MELIFKHDKGDSRKKLTSPELCIPFNQTVKNWFAHVNGKQPVLPVTFRENKPTLLHARSCLRSWRDSCTRRTFLAAESPCEVRGKIPPAGFSLSLVIDLYVLLSCGSAAKRMQRSHAYPAICAGYAHCKVSTKQSFLLLKHLFIHTKFSIRIILIYIVLIKIELTFD